MKKDKLLEEILGEEHAITPSDIFGKQFKRARFSRGYDRKDVDGFLEHVADALEDLIVQLRLLKEKNEEHRRAIAEFKDAEATLRRALVASQYMGDAVLDSAKREARVILEEAKLKKAEAQLEASRVPASLTRDIHILEQQRSRLRVEILAILETHRKLLDSLVPETAMHTPASFFEVGQPEEEKHLPHEEEHVRLTGPQEEAPAKTASEPSPDEDVETSKAAADTKPETSSVDFTSEELDQLVDGSPPIREDVEDVEDVVE